MSVTQFWLAIGLCWCLLAGLSGCGQGASPVAPPPQRHEAAELRKALAEEQAARAEWEKRARRLAADVAELKRRLAELGSPSAAHIREAERLIRESQGTPEWIKIERGMKIDELQRRRGYKMGPNALDDRANAPLFRAR